MSGNDVQCQQCLLKFNNKSELYIHVSISHQEDLFPAIEPQMKREKSLQKMLQALTTVKVY